MAKNIVISLGMKALGLDSQIATAGGQLRAMRPAAQMIARLAKQGHRITIVPSASIQIGRILLATEEAMGMPSMPLDVCVAMAGGQVGYQLQQAIRQALEAEEIDRDVLTIMSEVCVSRDDITFIDPFKPIGDFYNQEVAAYIAKEKDWTMKETPGKGYRRTVPSPLPERIVEFDAIEQAGQNSIVICCMGGGIPVFDDDGQYEGTEAVIEPDYTAGLLAEKLGADIFLMLTDVDQVAVNFESMSHQPIEVFNYQLADLLMDEGQFTPGMMLPKIQMACSFIKAHPDKKAIVTSIEAVDLALAGEGGSTFTFE